MTERESFPDDDLGSVDPDERAPADDGAPPLESNESDWQEQRQVVEDPDEDEIR